MRTVLSAGIMLAALCLVFAGGAGIESRARAAEDGSLSGKAVPAAVPAGAIDILNLNSFWRWQVTYSKPTIPVALLKASGLPGDANASEPKLLQHGQVDMLTGPAAPADWMASAFDDSAWPRARGTELGQLAFNQLSSAIVCLRGRFEVPDVAAAKGLVLTLKYVGGAAVYVNGNEVWRGDLPDGPLTPQTRATPYPAEAYVDAKGQGIPYVNRRNQLPADERADLEARIAKRFRSTGSPTRAAPSGPPR